MNRNERRRAAKTNSAPAAAATLNRAFAHHQAGDLRAAEPLYRQILAADPNHPEAMRLLGEVLIDTGRTEQAIQLLRRLTALYPAHFISHYTLATAFRLAGRTDDALASYNEALSLSPGFAAAHHGLGATHRAAGREAEAAEHFAAAAKADPNWPLAWNDLGMSLAALGKLDAAATALQRALTLDPNLAETRRHLLTIQETTTPETIATMQADLNNPRLSAAAKVETGFALGKLLDKSGQFNAAFQQFAAANQRLRAIHAQAGLTFDRARLTADIGKIIAAFPAAAFPARAGWGLPAELPVFIIGMPRSGTTLVEQIAASHPAIFGLGESKAIGGIAGKIGWGPSPAWTPETITATAAAHLASLARQGGGATRVTDKMPDNIFQLGLIATLYPNARIIFCSRDPLDTCLSCFTQRFAEPHGFDTDLADCGFRHREIDRLTRHWQAVLPLRMMRISYEALVTDPETESRKLIDYLGLPWDPACVDFHRTERIVKTASWAQVRQPAYRHAIGRAQNYRAHLGPLIAALAGEH